MNTVTELMKEEDDAPLTTSIQTGLDYDQTERHVSTWLLAVVGRYNGARITKTTKPGGNTIAFHADHEGETVAALVVNGPDTRWL